MIIFLTLSAVSALFLSVIEIGFRIGRRNLPHTDNEAATQIGIIQGTMATLLALLLGFTVSMAESRYDVRKRNAVDEANAIGTAFFRASLNPDSEQENIRSIFRQYIDVRLRFYDETLDDKGSLQLTQKTASLQRMLWSGASRWARKDPHSLNASFFLQSLNEVFDLGEKQARAFQNFIPRSIIALLIAIATLTLGAIGYRSGLSTGRHFVLSSLLCIVIAMTLSVIFDLERPRQGLIQASFDSIVRVREMVKDETVK